MANTIIGTNGPETLNGTNGDDLILGNGGNDILNGLGGNDILTGGSGTDTMTGGTGADTFQDTAAGLNGDTITDFLPGDRIQITDLVSTSAMINFDVSTGTLTYSDGSGHNGSVHISNAVPGRFVVRAINGGGAEVRLQQDAHNDFDGSGRSDILLRNDDGTVTDWLAQPAGSLAVNSANFQITASADWHIIATGDYNGDGRVDIMWRSDSGTVTNWLGTGNGAFSNNWNNFNMHADGSWQIIASADFNGDGRDDIMWRSTDGTVTDWLGDQNGGFTNNWTGFNMHADANWQIIGTGDFNGDGRADLLWRSTDGTVTNWLADENGGFTNNWTNFNMHADASWQIVQVGDFNGDGLSDLLWRSTDGTVTDWLGQPNGGFTNNFANFNIHADASWQIVQVGDFNGDAIDDLLWRNTSGQMSTWVGTASGGFDPTHGWIGSAASSWHVQDPFF